MPIDPLLLGGLIVVAIVVVIVMVRQRGEGVTTISTPSTPTPSSGAAPTGEPSTGDLAEQVRALLAKNQKLEAIKLVRQHTGQGLKESKDYVDALEHGQSPALQAIQVAPAPLGQDDLHHQVRDLLAKNQKIEAVKLVRQHTGQGLKESKDYVDALERGQSPALPAIQVAPALLGQDDLHHQVRALLAKNQKIVAIKLVRQLTGLGLKEAKEYVEGLEP